MREGYAGFRDEKSGEIGTLNARASSNLKGAERSDSAITLNAFEVSKAIAGSVAAPRSPGSASGRLSAPAAAEAMRNIESTQQATRVVAGKTFFQNGTRWTDSETQSRKPAKTVRVQFASDEYFRLLVEKPQSAAWMALGQNVQFALGDTLYEVTE
jgi:hypothetical protein